jgi:hypothetical protein
MAMTDDLLSGNIGNILNFLAAAGGLGTAAYGLVDASKAIAGGMSNPGFGYIRNAVEPLVGAAGAAGGGGATAFGRSQILATLRANWLNGVAKADQKAIAKSLIRLGLTPENAPRLAAATGVDAAHLTAAARSAHDGQPLTQQDIDILGEFDAIVSAVLDLGYERADQLYRNAAKIVAALVAMLLSAIAGGLIYYHNSEHPSLGEYVFSNRFLLAVFVGAISTPLAPIAKDLSSSLQAAVKAVGAIRR